MLGITLLRDPQKQCYGCPISSLGHDSELDSTVITCSAASSTSPLRYICRPAITDEMVRRNNAFGNIIPLTRKETPVAMFLVVFGSPSHFANPFLIRFATLMRRLWELSGKTNFNKFTSFQKN